MKKFGVRCMAVMLLLFVSLFPVKALAANNGSVTQTAAGTKATGDRPVTVAYIDYDHFVEKQEDGSYTGFAAEYLAQIASYTGWNYEFLEMDWPSAYQKVLDGEVDFYCVARRTEEREPLFDFSSYALCDEEMNLYVLPDKQIDYEDFKTFDGMRIGMLADSGEINYMQAYADKNRFEFTLQEYESNHLAIQALRDGEVDAIGLVNYSVDDDLVMVANFGITPAYMMSCNDSDYMKEFSAAQETLLFEHPDFLQNLTEMYYPANDRVMFSAEERQYISDAPVIRVGIIPTRKPLSYYDEKTGEIYGITCDIIEEISRISGLKFELTPIKKDGMPIEYLKGGNCDIVAGVMDSDQFRQDPGLMISGGFLKSELAIVMKNGMRFDPSQEYRVAVSSAFQALQDYLAEDYPHWKLDMYSKVDCLKAVYEGRADITIQNQYELNYALQKPVYGSFMAIPTSFYQDNSVFAMRSDADPLLLTVLNKSIELLDADTVAAIIINNNVSRPYKFTMEDFMYEYKYPLIAVSTLVLFVIVLMVVIVIIKQRNTKRLEHKNEELSEAIAAAEKANSAKSRFLAQMSHEIRTPMNAIIGLTEIARDETENPEKITEYLAKIARSSTLLLGIINDILDMSAIEGGKLKIGRMPYDFKKQLSDITSMFYQQAKQKGIQFSVHMKGVTEETIEGDELRVNQILMNLLSNAIKFTRAGETVDLTVIQTSKTQDKVYFRFVVADTGCGMSEDMLKRLYAPFEQESVLTAHKHGGSGLGLAITKNLVEMMGGFIKAESKPEEGTVFTVDIPFGACEQPICSDPEGFGDIRTLVVDDDMESCEYSGVLLKRLGVRYDCALSGEEALEMLGEAEDEKDFYRLCIIDWRMPKMNGLEVTQKIREIFGNETIVIIVSSYDLNELEADGRAAGADYFMAKPLFQSTIFNALMRISGGRYEKQESNTEVKYFDFTGKHVLVAEDVALNLEVAIKLLKKVGFEVTCAEDGRQALHLYEKSEDRAYDCILLDINMPVMDGYEAARRIRASAKPDAKTIPIYAMTANAFAEDIALSLDAGMNGHIAKPIETSVLYETLNEALKEKSDEPI